MKTPMIMLMVVVAEMIEMAVVVKMMMVAWW